MALADTCHWGCCGCCFFKILFSFLTALAFGLSAGGREAGETAAVVVLVVLVADETLELVVVIGLLLLMALGLVTITLSLDCC